MKRPLKIPNGRAAVLCVDLQEEHRRDSRYLVEDFAAVLANVRRLQDTARANGVPVLHCAYVVDLDSGDAPPLHPVQPDGTSVFSDKSDPLIAVCPEVAPVGDEMLMIKGEASAFGIAALEADLRARGIEWLAIAGVWTEACIDATVKGAVARGFRVLLVKDACGSGSRAMHQTGILNLANRLYGGAVVDTDAACRLLAGDTVEAWRIEGSVPLRYSFETAETLYAQL